MRRLPFQILLVSLVLTGFTVLATFFAVRVLEGSAALTQALGEKQLSTLEETDRIQELLFEKGFVATYLATHDRVWLDRLRERQKRTRTWLDETIANSEPGDHRELAIRLRQAYDEYSELRRRTVVAFESGDAELAVDALDETTPAVEKVLIAAQALGASSRHDLLANLERNDRLLDRARMGLVVFSAAALLLGIAVGVYSGRRIARPIYELILQAESASPDRVRLTAADGSEPKDDLDILSAHVTQLVQRLSDQRRRLNQAEKMQAVGEIAAKLAHEILNPVAGAKAALQVELRARPLPEETRTALLDADGALSRIGGILDRLMRYTRPLEPRYLCVPAEKVVEQALKQCSHVLELQQVTAEVKLPGGPVLLNVDPDLIAQVLTNLVANAAQASPPGEVVQLTGAQRRGAFVFEVVDRGRGLPAQRDKLFAPYFTTREKGHGLGLAVCRNIVTEHGGTIDATDAGDGRGARFTVTLPQREEPWESRS
jgi:signal transduction histidine kinase